MLNSAFEFAFSEFEGLETQIQFQAPFEQVSMAFNNGYLKWPIEGLGEACGFMFRLRTNGKCFIVKTFVNIVGLPEDQAIEWLIDAATLDCATQVFYGLNLNSTEIQWKKGD